MKTITITGINIQRVYDPYFKPHVCVSDIDLPEMYNQGYNSFRFIGGEPNFIAQNIPTHVRMETDNYIFEESTIQVLRSNGTYVYGNYFQTTNKNTGEVQKTFSFE